MKRITILFCAVLLTLALTSCTPTDTTPGDGQQQTPNWKIETRETSSNDAGLELELKVPVISGLANEQLQEQINNQIQADVNEMRTELSQGYAEFIADTETAGSAVNSFMLHVDYEAHANGQLLSLIVQTSWYSGGAHGQAKKDFYNVDNKNGKLLTLPDLFKADAPYVAIINDEIKKQIDAAAQDGQSPYFEGEMGFQSIDAQHPFYLQDRQLILHFSQYEIAPYVTGMPEFALPLADLTKQLQPSFLQLLPAP